MGTTDPSGKRVVVSGGSSGLGLKLATRLAADGASVALIARDEDRLEQARKRILASVPDALVLTASVDVIDEAALATAFERVAHELGGIDMLINSAGILREGYFDLCAGSMFREVMDINYFGVLNCTRAALPYLKKARGTLVNVASIGGLAGVFGYTAYNASKFAVVGLTEALYFELAPQGISVHLICPPEFDSAMVAGIAASRTPENRAHTLTIPKHDVDTIARESLAGIAQGRFLTVPGRRAKLAVALMRHLPGLTRTLGAARVRRVYRGPTTRGAQGHRLKVINHTSNKDPRDQ
jgi:3-dehydrosphinganine reductase